jgi:hypothetical protein
MLNEIKNLYAAWHGQNCWNVCEASVFKNRASTFVMYCKTRWWTKRRPQKHKCLRLGIFLDSFVTSSIFSQLPSSSSFIAESNVNTRCEPPTRAIWTTNRHHRAMYLWMPKQYKRQRKGGVPIALFTIFLISLAFIVACGNLSFRYSVQCQKYFVRSEVLTAMRKTSLFSWVPAQRRFLGRYQCFWEKCWVLLQGWKVVIYVRVYTTWQHRTTAATNALCVVISPSTVFWESNLNENRVNE